MKCLSVILIACIVLGAVECGKKKKNKVKGSKVVIVNGEEENSTNMNCAKVCSGTTGRKVTDWKQYNNEDMAAYVDVDISGCGFTKIPVVTTSLEGGSSHWVSQGTSSVYDATAQGFRVYIKTDAVNINQWNSDSYFWNIDWIAVGFVC